VDFLSFDDEVYFSTIGLHLAVETIYARVKNDGIRKFLAAKEIV